MPEDENVRTNADAGGDNNVASTEGQVSAEVTDFYKAINAKLGTTYKSDDAAVQGLKELQSYVGRKQETVIPPELTNKVTELEKLVRTQGFYTTHPEFNDPEVKALISELGSDPEEVVKRDTFKNAFEAFKVKQEAEKGKSVLHTNPRLGQATDTFTKAQEAAKAGNTTQADMLATEAVIEAFGMRE